MAAPLTVPVLLGLALHRSARRVTSRASGRSGKASLALRDDAFDPELQARQNTIAPTQSYDSTSEAHRRLMRPFAGRDALRDDASIPSLQARQNTADPISRAQRVAFAGE